MDNVDYGRTGKNLPHLRSVAKMRIISKPGLSRSNFYVAGWQFTVWYNTISGKLFDARKHRVNSFRNNNIIDALWLLIQQWTTKFFRFQQTFCKSRYIRPGKTNILATLSSMMFLIQSLRPGSMSMSRFVRNSMLKSTWKMEVKESKEEMCVYLSL